MIVEYESVRGDGAGLIDLSASRGRIRVSGSEATMFLNGLITNDIKTATENNWLPAVFPTVQGRLIGAVRILRLDDGFFDRHRSCLTRFSHENNLAVDNGG